MDTPDSLDSLFSIYDNPPNDRKNRSKIYLHLMLLNEGLHEFIRIHEIGDTDEDLSALITTLIRTRRSIAKYMIWLTQQPGKA